MMRTLSAPTVTVLTAVLVNRDLMETEKLVKVICVQSLSRNNQRKSFRKCDIVNLSKCSSCDSSDFDECLTEPGPCGDNADCTNNDGSYSCTCKQGFTGNGIICQGV